MAMTIVNPEAAPVVVSPSGHFDGNDGPWSSFTIQAGSPPQSVRVLVSTSLAETWFISASIDQSRCLATDPPGCVQSRGGLFSTNSSTSWQHKGLYELGLAEVFGNHIGNCEIEDYGSDAIELSLAGSSSVRSDSQTIATIATEDVDLGFLGISNRRNHFTSLSRGQGSFLESMKASGNIPSLSYAYSAGAQYRDGTLGTLTLGGYDDARAIPNNLSFSMTETLSRDLVVGLHSIAFSDTTGNTKTLSSRPILTFIDSTVPYLWLPEDVCSEFEEAFGITWNSTIDRYLVNETLNSILQKQNASVSFLLGNETSEDTTVNITLPYASFDLELGLPFVDRKTKYFPLRRAANATQYTLGRTFLQEAYLIVDYERLNFSVLQNKWSRDSTPQIVPISTTNNRNSVVNESDSSTNDGKAISSHKMTAGKIADITVAAFLICAIATKVAGFYFNHRRRRRKEEQPVDSKVVQARDPLEELDTSSKPSPEADSSSVNLRMHVLNGEEYNPVNSIQLYVENLTRYAWDWWPLRPSFRELLKNEIRIQWYCVSGHAHWTVLSKAVTVFTPARRKKSESTFEKKSSLSTSTSRSSGEVSVDHSSPAISKSDLSDQLDNETDSEKEGNSSVPSTAIEIMPSSKMTGFVLFGVHGSKRLQSAYLRLAQIDVAGKDDDSFFDEMIVQYKKLRGFLRRNFSIWIFHTCDFIRLHKANPNEIMPGPKEIPSPQDPDYYYYNQSREPPVLSTVFNANFYGCTKPCIKSQLDLLCLFHQCKGRNRCGKYRVLEHLPKRRKKWEIDQDAEKEEAWGLNAVFAVSFYKVILYHMLILAGPTISWGLWLKKWPTDWQNASVPFFAVVVLLSLFWLPFAHNAKSHSS